MLYCGRLRPHRRLIAGAAAAIAALLLFAPRSTAGVYHVFSCRIPYGTLEGQAAPVETGEGEVGWTHIVAADAQYGDLCASHGALVASLQAGTSHTDADVATWQFGAGPDQTIRQAVLWLAGDADGGSGYLFWLASPANPAIKAAMSGEDFVSGCVYTLGCHGEGDIAEPLAEVNKVQIPEGNLGGSHLYINASCSSSSCPSDNGDEQGHAVIVYLYAADIALEEQASPTAGNLNGELAGSEPLSGTASLFFQASDVGSGVFKEIVSVDGEVVSSQIVDETGLCKEVPVPAGDGPAFLSAQPCPPTANGRVSLDTTALTNGTHHLLVEVTNAAGNATTVLSKTIEVANETGSNAGSARQNAPSAATGQSGSGQPNGTPSSANPTLRATWSKARAAKLQGSSQLTGAFDHPETITGRLTGPTGSAIADATIELTAHESYGGAPTLALGSATTDSQGDFSFHLAKQSPSERIELSYSPTLGGTPVVSQTMALRVLAGIKLDVSPGSVSAGGTISLQGRILGAPIPPGGKQVVLEARSQGSRWLQFLVLRSGRNGRFKGTHRFRLPGPVRYFFRAVCPEEADFPFATGVSGQASAWER